MKTPFARLSILWKILLSTSVAITVLFAVTGWIVVATATRTTTESVNHEVQASFKAYQSLWRSRAERLASATLILSAMSDVRAAFGTGDAATIRDTAGELWARASDQDAVFLVTDPGGRVIASLGGPARENLPAELDIVGKALPRFPEQATGFTVRGGRLYHLTVTPVYVQATGGTALINVLVAGYEVTNAVAIRLKQETGGSEFVFAAGGRILASTLPPATSAEVARRISGSVPATLHAGSNEYVPLVTALEGVSGAPAGRLAILRSFDASRRQISDLRRNVALVWLFSMAAGLWLTYLMARKIVEPVKALDRAAGEVARQNYDCHVPVESEDELGRLAATFNSMCASIRRAREELIQTERIATVGRLASSIVHDLRNPLGAIYGGAEMLVERRLSPEQVERLGRNIFRASRDIQRMLDHLLNVCRGRTDEPENCTVAELAAAALEFAGPAAERHGVEIALEIDKGLEVSVERNRVERVFTNLIANAVDVMPDGGRVEIGARAEEPFAVIRVRDTGPGIPPEIRDKLFQPFVTARKKSGLGLGLALSRQTIIDQGGEMWVEAEDRHGACFVFRLPLAHVSAGVRVKR